LPWSAKARELIREQYAAVGAAGETSLRTLVELTARRPELASSASERLNALERFRAAYRKYCWSVNTVTDLKLAPFHILATEGRAHVDKNNQWHMETAHRIAARDPAIWRATPYRVLRLDDDAACQAAADWWEELTASGGEGMVVKPLEFVTRGPKGMVQPALKVRGREYLRIIYGPEYTRHIGQLRRRTLSVKRNFALREFQLGLEALDRFVRREPLRRVHECVFGVLALESEPVDPRL
jgi:protein phosphatase